MSCRPMHKKSILLPHSMKTASKTEFETDQNYYVDLRQTYLALKLKLVRVRG